MLTNRSMPASHVIPVLSYPDLSSAIDWLTTVFGFSLRWQAGNHRAQLNVGDGCIAITQGAKAAAQGFSIMVRVDDLDEHLKNVSDAGVEVVEPPAEFPYGERQYTVRDLAGHLWTFSQTIADVAPEDWGGQSFQL